MYKSARPEAKMIMGCERQAKVENGAVRKKQVPRRLAPKPGGGESQQAGEERSGKAGDRGCRGGWVKCRYAAPRAEARKPGKGAGTRREEGDRATQARPGLHLGAADLAGDSGSDGDGGGSRGAERAGVAEATAAAAPGAGGGRAGGGAYRARRAHVTRSPR
jgi:hypothetical protein